MDLVDVAENAFGLVEPIAGTRVVADDLILLDQSGPAIFRMALRLRFPASQTEERIRQIRAWFHERGRDDFTWWIGSFAPPGLEEHVLADGGELEEDGIVAAMVLRGEPPCVSGIEIRPVLTLDDARISQRLMRLGFGLSDQALPELTQEVFDAAVASQRGQTFVAFIDEEPVGRAMSVITEAGAAQLGVATVLEEYRGRGAYKALIRARWEWAKQRGISTLVTQSGQMSRPILERVGFETVGNLRIVRDTTAPPSFS